MLHLNMHRESFTSIKKKKLDSYKELSFCINKRRQAGDYREGSIVKSPPTLQRANLQGQRAFIVEFLTVFWFLEILGKIGTRRYV